MSNASSRHRSTAVDLAHRGDEVHTADVPPRRRRIGRTAALSATVALVATACGNKPLDTFDDQRRAYVFTVNPLGVQHDGLWNDSGGGTGQWSRRPNHR